MEQREIPDYATDVYLIERLRKFEIDKIEADRAAIRSLLHGAKNGCYLMALIGAVVYAIFKIVG